MNTIAQPGRFEKVIKFMTLVLLITGLGSNLILAGMHYRDPWVRMKIFFLFHEKRPEYKRMFLKKYHVFQVVDPYEKRPLKKQPRFIDPYVKQPTPEPMSKNILSPEDEIKQIPKCRVALALVLIYQEPLENTHPVCYCRHAFRDQYEYGCGIGVIDFGFTEPVLIPFSTAGCAVYFLLLILFILRKKRIYSILFYFLFICYTLIPAYVVVNLYFLHSKFPDFIYRMLYPYKYEFEPLIIFAIIFLLLATFIIDLINAIIVRSCIVTLNKKQTKAS